MRSNRYVLLGVGAVALIATYLLVGFWTTSPVGRVMLTILAFPVVISVAAAVTSFAVALLPVPKVPQVQCGRS